jgi:hypothetical protein
VGVSQPDDLDAVLRAAVEHRSLDAEDLLSRIRERLPRRAPAVRTGASLGEWVDMILVVGIVGGCSVAVQAITASTPIAGYVAVAVILLGMVLFAGSIVRTLLDGRSFIRRAPLAIWRHPPQVAGIALVVMGVGLHVL